MSLYANEPARYSVSPGLIHDLRTPLNQIIGYSEMLIEQSHDVGQDTLVLDLQKVHVAGQQLLAVIDDNFLPSATPSEVRPAADSLVDPPVRVDDAFAAVSSTAESLLDDGVAGALRGVLLVVDDNEANRDLLSRRLERQGYAVCAAQNGKQALEMMRAQAFDLVLLDIMMPEMDGYDVLKKLKDDELLRHIPVIMVSALNELDSVARCIEMGAEDYLPKPFNPTLLKARVGACLERKRAHDREANLYEQLQGNYKRLQDLEMLRDDLTHMIIHDLRTPLTSVIAGMQTLEELGDLNAAQLEVKTISVEGGETLLGMINDLLDIEKLESGGMNLNDSKFSVAELVNSAVGQVASLAESKQLSLTTDVLAGLAPLRGDESKIRRTLVNLIGNAIKFTPCGGAIHVEAGRSENGKSVLFSVKDNGEGIPPEAFERIFEKFGQVDSRKGGRTNGTGLGLTFCKLTIEAHGGKIGVESEPTKGSKFHFTIPA